MIPPIDPATLAAIMGGQGGSVASAISPQGILANTNFNNLPINAAGNVQAPTLASNVASATTAPVNMNRQTNITGQTLGGAVGAPAIPSIPTGVPAAPQKPADMLGEIGSAFDSMAAKPSDFGPITAASRSGFSQQMPDMQTNPYGSAAANKGLLELLQGAYSLGV